MQQSSKTYFIFKSIDKVTSLALMILGIYLIYKGEVLNRFHLKRTNFAEFTEEVTEIPTVTTWIEYSNGPFLKYWSDFYIQFYNWENNTSIDLEIGKNQISGSTLRVYVEEFFDYDHSFQTFRITPLNFLPGMPFRFTLKYKFETQFGANISSVSIIAVALSTQNNSYCGDGATFYDGELKDVRASLGQKKYMQVRPEKIIYSQENEKCRSKPYHDTLLETTLQRAKFRCGKPCIPSGYRSCKDIAQNRTKICENERDKKCFYEILTAVEKEIIVKPCTVFQYFVDETTYNWESDNTVKFEMVYATPARVNVKEEYLIYDMVSMIGAIGGTMGLCIGFSFKDCARWGLSYVEQSVNWIVSRSIDRKVPISSWNAKNVELGLREDWQNKYKQVY